MEDKISEHLYSLFYEVFKSIEEKLIENGNWKGEIKLNEVSDQSLDITAKILTYIMAENADNYEGMRNTMINNENNWVLNGLHIYKRLLSISEISVRRVLGNSNNNII